MRTRSSRLPARLPTPRIAVAAVLTTAVVAAGASTQVARADDEIPTRAEVRAAQEAVRVGELDLAGVRTALADATTRLADATLVAARASEAFNGARYEADLAREDADRARSRARAADADVERQRDTYADSVVSSYTMSPDLTALASMVDSDELESVVQKSATLGIAEDALDARYGELRAASTRAEVVRDAAGDAERTAESAEADAEEARDTAQAAADSVATQASAAADEKEQLVSRQAELEGVSVDVARARQDGLERQAAERRAEETRRVLEEQVPAETEPRTSEPTTSEPSTPEPSTPEPSPPEPTTPEPDPAPEPPDTTPPAPSGGAAAAVSFARAQLGETYVWGAAGPSSWDCSGLMMGAWEAGGRSLPHYSVAQYEQSTPISAGDLRPGDLVFWGDSSSASSIYHVAMYAGDGMIIHAPRAGRPVVEESIYYWIAPNFYARP